MTKKVKSNIELLIELRNQVAFRLISQEASELYWMEISKKTKKNSQERVDALQKVVANQQLSSADKKYLQIIDDMLGVHNG